MSNQRYHYQLIQPQDIYKPATYNHAVKAIRFMQRGELWEL